MKFSERSHFVIGTVATSPDMRATLELTLDLPDGKFNLSPKVLEALLLEQLVRTRKELKEVLEYASKTR